MSLHYYAAVDESFGLKLLMEPSLSKIASCFIKWLPNQESKNEFVCHAEVESYVNDFVFGWLVEDVDGKSAELSKSFLGEAVKINRIESHSSLCICILCAACIHVFRASL
jgi:hypothetical protein